MSKLSLMIGGCLLLAASTAACQQRPVSSGLSEAGNARMNEEMDRQVGLAAASAYGWNPADVVVELHCQRLGNTSVTIGHRISSQDGATLYADGHVVMVWVERASGRPTPLPDAVRRAAGG